MAHRRPKPRRAATTVKLQGLRCYSIRLSVLGRPACEARGAHPFIVHSQDVAPRDGLNIFQRRPGLSVRATAGLGTLSTSVSSTILVPSARKSRNN